jgi:hypothetical protein
MVVPNVPLLLLVPMPQVVEDKHVVIHIEENPE